MLDSAITVKLSRTLYSIVTFCIAVTVYSKLKDAHVRMDEQQAEIERLQEEVRILKDKLDGGDEGIELIPSAVLSLFYKPLF